MLFQLESSNELLDLGLDSKKRFFLQKLVKWHIDSRVL